MVGIFVAIQMVVGLVQLTTASYYNDGGKTLKYIVFAPWYMLVYWMVNTWTRRVRVRPDGRGRSGHREAAGPGSRPSAPTSLQDLGPAPEEAVMTEKPGYVVHEVTKTDVTVDWFFGDRPCRQKIPQLVLLLIGWFFALCPSWSPPLH